MEEGKENTRESEMCVLLYTAGMGNSQRRELCACVCARARDWDRNSGGGASLQVNLFHLNQPEKQTGLNTSSHGCV